MKFVARGVPLCATLLAVTALCAGAQSVIPRAAGRATVLRDDWGVPHVYAAREADGYFGLGYALAEDRLESVLRRYAAASGRLASIFGPDSLAKDLTRLQWRHLENARVGLRRMSPQLQRDYTMFVAGIHQYMVSHPGRVPHWARRFAIEPAMVVAWGRAWALYWAEGVNECVAGGAPVSPDLVASLSRDGRAMPASNAWTVSPSRSADGAAMLVGDSHSEFSGNGEMFEFRIDAGPLKAAGTSGVGLPWLIVGHTRALAWTTTNRGYDGADCYEVQVDSADPRRYRFDGKWKRMTVRTVTVAVKDRASVTRVFEYTDHNGVLSPVVARRGTSAWVASDPYMERAGLLDEQMHGFLLARDIADVRTSQRVQEMWPTNLLTADSSGNTYYLRTGRIPIRVPGYDWTRPLNGNTSATSWRGIHELEDLVQLENPAPGYMQNNNVSPDMMFPGSPLTADRYAPEVYGEPPGTTNFRGRRAIALLSQTFHGGIADMLAILFDEKWDGADQFRAGLLAALERHVSEVGANSRSVRRFTQRLARFDGVADKGSVAALSYLYWRRAMSESPSSNRELVRLAMHDSMPGPPYDAALLSAIPRAIELLEHDFSSTDLALGDVFRVGRGGVSLPLGGFVGTMRAMAFGPPDSVGQQWVRSGQRQPMVVVFTKPIQSYTSLNFGQSNDPRSPHFADQSLLMSEKRLKPTYFDEGALIGHVIAREMLTVQ